MNIEIKKLCEKYNEKKSFQIYNSDISIVMEFDEKQFDDYTISISMNKIDNIYYIFLFIENYNRILLKGLINESNSEPTKIYLQLKEDLLNLNLDKLLDKYGKIIEKNF